MAAIQLTITNPARLGVKYFPSPDGTLPAQIRLDVIDDTGDTVHVWLPIPTANYVGMKLSAAAARHTQEEKDHDGTKQDTET